MAEPSAPAGYFRKRKPIAGCLRRLIRGGRGHYVKPRHEQGGCPGGIRELSAESGLAFKRTQRQTDAGHDGIPRALFFLRIGEIKAVDDAS